MAARVIESRALQAQRSANRFTLELCTETAPLCAALLASPAAAHHQAALQLLQEMLARWGDYMRGTLRRVGGLVWQRQAACTPCLQEAR